MATVLIVVVAMFASCTKGVEEVQLFWLHNYEG